MAKGAHAHIRVDSQLSRSYLLLLDVLIVVLFFYY